MDEWSYRGNTLVSIILFVEGGGSRSIQKKQARRGFRLFLEKAGLEGRMPRIMPCGSRDNAYRDFKSSRSVAEAIAVLLVDSEDPVTAETPWQHLKSRDNWDRPPESTDEQCHLMVQVMESWFLADRETLIDYYGRYFHENPLPRRQNIEKVPKADVLSGLNRATQNTKKGRYDKGRHSFEILATLDPTKVMNASPHARRLVDSLKEFGSSS